MMLILVTGGARKNLLNSLQQVEYKQERTLAMKYYYMIIT